MSPTSEIIALSAINEEEDDTLNLNFVLKKKKKLNCCERQVRFL
jgi:hypothetical protein